MTDAGMDATADAGVTAPRVLGPFAWPPGATSKMVCVSGQECSLVSTTRRGTDEIAISRIGEPLHPEGHVVRDLDGDGAPELVIFLSSAPEPTFSGEKQTLLAFGLDRGGAPRRLPLLEYRLIGVADPNALGRELTRLHQLGPIDGVALERLVVRLPLASPDELRSLIAPAGIDLCEQTEITPRKCIHRRREAVDLALAQSIAGCAGKFDPFFTQDPKLLELPVCNEASGNTIACTANAHSQEGGTWKFHNVHGVWRLEEVMSFFAGTGSVERGICSSAPPPR